MVIAWRSVVDGCVLICLLCRVFFKVRANRRVGKSKDPKNRVPEIAVPELVSAMLAELLYYVDKQLTKTDRRGAATSFLSHSTFFVVVVVASADCPTGQSRVPARIVARSVVQPVYLTSLLAADCCVR